MPLHKDSPIFSSNQPGQIRKSASPIKAELINLEEHMIPLLPAVHVHIGSGLLNTHNNVRR